MLPPGTSTGPHLHQEVAEFYYVMNGQGTVTVSAGGPGGRGAGGAETAEIQAGDAIPIQLGEVHSFENTGRRPSGIHDRRHVPWTPTKESTVSTPSASFPAAAAAIDVGQALSPANAALTFIM